MAGPSGEHHAFASLSRLSTLGEHNCLATSDLLKIAADDRFPLEVLANAREPHGICDGGERRH
jgi:hypothetical protein